MVRYGVQEANVVFIKQLTVAKLGNAPFLFPTKLEFLKSQSTQRILKSFTQQLINEEDLNQLISVEDQNQHFINQQMEAKLGKKLTRDFLKQTWEELELQFHQLMLITFTQSLKADMEKADFIALRIKVKIGQNKAILIQAETTTKK